MGLLDPTLSIFLIKVILLFYIYVFNPVLEIFDNYCLFLSLVYDFEIVWSNKNSFYFPYLDFPPQISSFELCTFSLFSWSMKTLKKFYPFIIFCKLGGGGVTMQIISSLLKSSCSRRQSHRNLNTPNKCYFMLSPEYRFCYIIMLFLLFFSNCFCWECLTLGTWLWSKVCRLCCSFIAWSWEKDNIHYNGRIILGML